MDHAFVLGESESVEFDADDPPGESVEAVVKPNQVVPVDSGLLVFDSPVNGVVEDAVFSEGNLLERGHKEGDKSDDHDPDDD